MTSNFSIRLNPIYFTLVSRPSKYLKMPKKLLIRSLRLQLNHRIKKKKDQLFIVSRLQLLDRQFCLNLNLRLYQSYFTEGKHHKIWPVSRHFIINVLPVSISFEG